MFQEQANFENFPCVSSRCQTSPNTCALLKTGRIVPKFLTYNRHTAGIFLTSLALFQFIGAQHQWIAFWKKRNFPSSNLIRWFENISPSFSEIPRISIGDSYNMGGYLILVGRFFRISVSFSFYGPLNLAQTTFSRGFWRPSIERLELGLVGNNR